MLNNYDYDLQAIKNSLTIDEIEQIVAELGGEPIRQNGNLICKTICHGGESHKLYWFSNSNLFHCFTDCATSFDIFELVQKVKTIETHIEWDLPKSVEFIAQKFGFSKNDIQLNEDSLLQKDYELFQQYDRIKDININTQQIELKEYKADFLKYLPRPRLPWEQEGINKSVMDYHNICYDPANAGIIIPHYDINNRLIGIRTRNLVEDNIEKYGKYRPAYIGGKMYNHPLGFALYNLNNVKANIQRMKKVFVFESEKSCLKYASYFGKENDLSVACCGSNLTPYQAWLLIPDVDEIIVGLDHDFTDLGSKEAQRIIKNLKSIHKKFGQYVKISFLWDKENRLGYKDSPIDGTPELFQELFKERIMIYD